MYDKTFDRILAKEEGGEVIRNWVINDMYES